MHAYIDTSMAACMHASIHTYMHTTPHIRACVLAALGGPHALHRCPVHGKASKRGSAQSWREGGGTAEYRRVPPSGHSLPQVPRIGRQRRHHRAVEMGRRLLGAGRGGRSFAAIACNRRIDLGTRRGCHSPSSARWHLAAASKPGRAGGASAGRSCEWRPAAASAVGVRYTAYALMRRAPVAQPICRTDRS
jgi:hypothetical protein